MKLERNTCLFQSEADADMFCRRLEADGFRSSELASQLLHRSYSVQCWTSGSTERRWRVEWHAYRSNA